MIQDFTSFKRPKIAVTKDIIYVTDLPFFFDFVIAIFMISITAYSIFREDSYDKPIGIILCTGFSIYFIYTAFSLKRVTIDLIQKTVCLRSIDPIENVLIRLLQRPTLIPFRNISKIYDDYTMSRVGRPDHFYVYLQTDDPYKIRIGRFKSKDEAKSFASFLSTIVHRVN